jgi:phenylpyruvate tautomerase PptA (4-oxalocrotonate tautomerase family)
MIEVLVTAMTDADRKRRLLAALVETLEAAGVDPNDIIVLFGEVDRASCSFGGGRFAPPIVFA